MSTAVAAPGAAPRAAAQQAEVARARIAVLVATYQVDVVVPTKFAVETFIDDLLGVLARAIDDETVDFTPPAGQWSLARPGEQPIPRWRSLADHDVVDGTVLMLSVVESAEVFTPVVEDITDALAAINEREFAEFDSETVATVGSAALGVGALVAAVLLSWSWTRSGSLWWCGLPALLLGAACWGAAVVAGRGRTPVRVVLGLELSALPLLFAGGAMLVPPAYGQPGGFAAANVAAGAVVAAVAAVTMLRASESGTSALTAVATIGVVLAFAALVPTYVDVSVEKVAGGIVFAAAVLLTAAPRLAVVAARIRPPDLPDPGNEVAPATLTDIFDAETVRADQLDQSADAERELRPNTGIETRARLAVTSLRGLIAAVSALLAGGVVVAAEQAPGGIREIVLGAAVAGILVMRARWYPDRVQAVSLCAASAVATVGVAAVTVGAYGTDYARLAVVGVLVVAAVAACVAALRLPGRRLSPVTRRVIDLVEYALILLVPVIAFWIMGIYTAMRAI
ncbi:type VII secretion integral membrane protein EccD [Nocardia nova]|uniref:Type VII secretion integral membrane protein EccD n=1 Tax=Nocardia nova TaxID=37330 RepID=A0A2S6ACT2_9NOCA|nr:type VII secretion integral membrane protein EccD [Nocardia nova]PPJ19694.1 type VII secretion integral membrane protein EccD [Nocardia nova]PPJ31837.1 type VII secretion integral membrane protein EccD [Nocardia nova]